MSQYRFEQIKRYLHVSNHETDQSGDYVFHKLEPLWSHIRNACEERWDPGFKISVDEMMIICQGRSSETVRMKNKPIPAGFKVWAAAQGGVVVNFIEHSNRYPWKYLERYKETMMHASAVVAYLVESLPKRAHSRKSSAQAQIRQLLTTGPPNNGNNSANTQIGARTVNVELEPKYATLPFSDSQK